MNRLQALGVLALLALGTAAALLAPPYAVAPLALAGVLGMRHGRRAHLLFVATAIPINTLLLALVVEGGATWGPFSEAGATLGLVGGLRLVAALGVNLAVLSWAPPSRLLEGLALPPRTTAYLAAMLLAAEDLARDFERLRDARRLEGEWPESRIARIRAAAGLTGPLLVAAYRRARTRQEALRMAGLGVGRHFVPIVAIAALCAAGRMAFLALPNVALTYAFAFLGGLLFGPWIAMAGALLGMAATDFLLTGLYPMPYLTAAPAMALLGLLGGLLRGFDLLGETRTARVAGAVFAACFGILGTFVFSVAADVLTWAIVAPGEPAALRALVLAGLAFNVLPALANGALFAFSVPPCLRAWKAATQGPARAPPTMAPEAASDAPAAAP